MISTLVMVYLGAWMLIAASTYCAGRILSDPDQPANNPMLVSLVAGAVWPLVVIGAVELSSMAAYSKASSMRADAEIYRSLHRGAANDVIVQMR